MQFNRMFFLFFALLIGASVAAPLPAGAGNSPDAVELSARGSKHMAQAVAIARKIKNALRPKADEPVFWSGSKSKSNGKSGPGVSVFNDAKKFAKKSGKTLIHQALRAHGITIPKTKENPHSPRLWNFASKVWAMRSHGSIHAVLGSNRRPGNVYDNIEKPTLLKNPKVTKLTEHDAETKKKTVVKGGQGK